MAIKQYPHYLFVSVTSQSQQDPTTGDWTEGGQAWQLYSVCREETNGKGQMINGTDGKAITFSSAMYMPKGTPRIQEGTTIRVTEVNDKDGQKRVEGSVLKFDNGQLSTRLWV